MKVEFDYIINGLVISGIIIGLILMSFDYIIIGGIIGVGSLVIRIILFFAFPVEFRNLGTSQINQNVVGN